MDIRPVALAALLAAPTAFAQDYRVVGGQQADDGTWPDAAGVVFSGSAVGCTGVLVAPDVALTAAHCLDGQTVTHVVLDAVDYRSRDAEIIEVEEQIEYPNWWSSYDIGVLVLRREANTEPRLIAQGCVLDDYLYDGAEVAIVGYGNTRPDGSGRTTRLMEAYTEVVDHDCSVISNGCERSVSPGGELGAGGDGTDACYGDSGGPLYLTTEVGDYVVGTTARAFAWVSNAYPCRDGGIYTRPDAVVDWIEDVSGREMPVPTCNFPPEPIYDDVLEVAQGTSRKANPGVEDPDGGPHTWEVVQDPEHGKAEITGGGAVKYTADDEYLGPDSFVVSVTDEGIPAHTTELVIDVEVVERACGCASTPGVPALGWAGVLIGLLALRRRRA